ncbi:Txe/YoeB family addiction module toxin [Achromobacter anxifer]
MSQKKKQKHKNKEEAAAHILGWTPEGWEDYLWWQDNNPKIVKEINGLLRECLRDPFKGTGKPEPLMGDLTGFWSRRITDKDRLVYCPDDGRIVVLMCSFHYK